MWHGFDQASQPPLASAHHLGEAGMRPRFIGPYSNYIRTISCVTGAHGWPRMLTSTHEAASCRAASSECKVVKIKGNRANSVTYGMEVEPTNKVLQTLF